MVVACSFISIQHDRSPVEEAWLGIFCEADSKLKPHFSSILCFQFVGELEIFVNLTNDNAPVRAVDRVFRVVRDGERLLTGQDLRYADADIDCGPADILYTRQEISNGGIYSALDGNSPLYQFTQVRLISHLVFNLGVFTRITAEISGFVPLDTHVLW